jgi:hypothetical protein
MNVIKQRDPKDIHIAAILYPNVTGSNYIDKEDKDGNHKHRQLLSGSIDQIGNDLFCLMRYVKYKHNKMN